MTAAGLERPTAHGWLVLFLTCAMMISDFMTRQVVSSILPLLKAEWTLSDAQLGWLTGAVPLSVGLLIVPLAFLADRWGRVRCVTLMGLVWSAATVIGAFAQDYVQLLAGRIVLGIAEAAYGCAGLAIIYSIFPQRLRSTVASIFLACGFVGLVLGAFLGGLLAETYGWRIAIAVIGIAGLLPVLPYPFLVKEKEAGSPVPGTARPTLAHAVASTLRQVLAGRTVRLIYLGNGLQYFAAGALPAWLPTYLVRYYDMSLGDAAGLTAISLLLTAIGMIACGYVSDRIARSRPHLEASAAVTISVVFGLLVLLAFQLEAGAAQLMAIAAAMFFVTGTSGIANAVIGNLTPGSIHGSAFATHALSINLLGLAPGPILIGWASDRIGLLDALRFLPIASMAAALLFWLARGSYRADMRASAALGQESAESRPRDHAT
jgi:MFS family permease